MDRLPGESLPCAKCGKAEIAWVHVRTCGIEGLQARIALVRASEAFGRPIGGDGWRATSCSAPRGQGRPLVAGRRCSGERPQHVPTPGYCSDAPKRNVARELLGRARRSVARYGCAENRQSPKTARLSAEMRKHQTALRGGSEARKYMLAKMERLKCVNTEMRKNGKFHEGEAEVRVNRNFGLLRMSDQECGKFVHFKMQSTEIRKNLITGRRITGRAVMRKGRSVSNHLIKFGRTLFRGSSAENGKRGKTGKPERS